MSRSTKQGFVSFLAGALFGVGLVVSGMTQPRKVIGFLDVLGSWDPSLVFVMLGAIAVHLVSYRWIRGRPSPLLADKFQIPSRRDIDAKLLAGAALFGVGWGLAGYCPGPSLVALPSGIPGVAVFVLALLVGMAAAARFERQPGRPPAYGSSEDLRRGTT